MFPTGAAFQTQVLLLGLRLTEASGLKASKQDLAVGFCTTSSYNLIFIQEGTP